MGLYDRPYMRDPDHGSGASGAGASWFLDHFNHLFIAANVVCWFLVNAGVRGPGGIGTLNPGEDNLALSLEHLQQYRYWTLLTYGMTDMGVWVMVFNMMLVYYFGNDLKALYGRLNLIWLYFLALVVPGGAFLLTAAMGHQPASDWYYGSEAVVLCILVVVTCWHPTRTLSIFFILPIPLWILTPLYVIVALMAFERTTVGRAFYAPPVAGAALGLLFYFFDLRIARGESFRWRTGLGAKLANWLIGGSGGGGGGGGGKKGGQTPTPLTRLERRESTYEVDLAHSEKARVGATEWDDSGKLSDADAARVDALLAKIAKEGKDALTNEELAFLHTASKKYH